VLWVVLDTNVLISILAFHGETTPIWDLAERKQFSLFTSIFILSELERNLLKLGLNADQAALLIGEVSGIASIVEPDVRVTIIKEDESDNRISECAIAAKADVVVTGNLKHIRPLTSFRCIDIVTPREFLDRHF
jgi:putative PIN family toxin of toxin-antitoxin system